MQVERKISPTCRTQALRCLHEGHWVSSSGPPLSQAVRVRSEIDARPIWDHARVCFHLAATITTTVKEALPADAIRSFHMRKTTMYRTPKSFKE